MGYLEVAHNQEIGVHQQIIHVSDVKATKGSHIIVRRKRNILFPNGVKLCAQETMQQVVANHLNYFNLRVCQETIWEAFKVFWDRLPEQVEYESWMKKCQEGSITAQDIGNYFSQSDEHQALVKKRMALTSVKSEPTKSWQTMCSSPTPETPKPAPGPDKDTKEEKIEEAAIVPEPEENLLNNDIALESPTPIVLEQVVQLSILLTGETFTDELNNPASLLYQTLSQQLTENIEDALEGLPGFRSVSVIDFRPHKDPQGLDGVVVDYAVTVVVDGTGVTSEQLDYLTLQSNLVESSYGMVKELPTMVYTISEVKSMVTEALQFGELESVSEVSESANTEEGAMIIEPVEEEDIERDNSPSDAFEISTVATGNDLIFLEESAVGPPEVVLTTATPEPSGVIEDGLLVEDIVQIPNVESPPAQVPPQVEPNVTVLSDPPLEVEASGSDGENLDDLLLTPTIEEVPFEETAQTADVNTEDDDTREVNVAEVVPILVHVPALEEHNLEEIIESDTEAKLSTITTETIGEEGLASLVPDPEVVDLTVETIQPEGAEVALLPVNELPVEDVLREVSPEEEEENIVSVPDEAVIEESETAITNEKTEELLDSVEDIPEAPMISSEDLTEDGIILVNVDSVQPTALSPEKESPFTRISDVNPASDVQPDIIITSTVEIETSDLDLDGEEGFEVIHYGVFNHTEEGSTGLPFDGMDHSSIAMPANPGRALMVFFSLRVTNMIFSEDLFNKSSAEYKALEQRFLELLVPYLQSNLSNFENLEILNFRNGSIVVNSRMKFGKPVPRETTTVVYLILEDFCNTAYQTMNLAIDKYSLDVESGDQADPCKFQACNEYAECKVNKWSGEAECVCNAGYFSVDGLPCQSICELQTDFCLNDGKCDIIPGQGAICRCRVGDNWWYRGEHCEEYVSEPLVVGIAIASVAGFLLVASGVIFFLARTLRDQYDKDESEDPIRQVESMPSMERATKYNPMYESEATTGYSHYYRRYPDVPMYSSASAEASTDFSSEEIRHIYENSELTKEEIQDRIRIIELYAKDRQFADFVRQHQAVIDTRRESSSAHT
ncbi:interphotoreceptor matrix proteoglycan 2 [Boleophthalmus pectinirostris]|uniref:interphotoreceptor matrix proteoglycan 2 n=1 Tax=Boleophthalmus pectinirostris TaxID=150288 RepID=UPI00242EA03D|nr:interphotoreceptor matrix proteoglycan 2 [Boleophthalmus pectinirostris]